MSACAQPKYGMAKKSLTDGPILTVEVVYDAAGPGGVVWVYPPLFAHGPDVIWAGRIDVAPVDDRAHIDGLALPRCAVISPNTNGPGCYRLADVSLRRRQSELINKCGPAPGGCLVCCRVRLPWYRDGNPRCYSCSGRGFGASMVRDSETLSD